MVYFKYEIFIVLSLEYNKFEKIFTNYFGKTKSIFTTNSPPRTATSPLEKPSLASLLGGAIFENPGYRDFKSRYWKKNPGCRDFKILVLEKILSTGISNPGTGKKLLGTEISNPSTGNRIYNRENFSGALRRHNRY
jgi:hypothetical protein